MGGNAFKDGQGNDLSTEIRREDVESTLDHFRKAVLEPIGIEGFVKLGSTGKKSVSGDLDIAVGIGDANKAQFKKEFVTNVGRILEPNRVKKVGQLAAVLYPIVDGNTGSLTGDSVQIDVMFTSSPEHTEWMMSGVGEGSVKGVYRNLMLAYIAKRRSLSQQAAGNDVKITISFPGGLQVKRGKEIIVPRTNKPSEVLKLLGLDIEPRNVSTFEDLVDHLAQNPKMRDVLEGFEEYIKPYLERDPKNAEKARDYVNRYLHESLRCLIRGILKG